jgi:hypothetical protein
MIPMAAARRRLGRWLVGLYVLGLMGGVVPLISCYSAHAAAPSVAFECKSATVPQQEHHHAGDTDDAARHHILLDLNGVLVQSSLVLNSIVHIALEVSAPRTLAEADVVLLERPPKASLLV